MPSFSSIRLKLYGLESDPLCTRQKSSPAVNGWEWAGVTADSVAMRVCPTQCVPLSFSNLYPEAGAHGCPISFHTPMLRPTDGTCSDGPYCTSHARPLSGNIAVVSAAWFSIDSILFPALV